MISDESKRELRELSLEELIAALREQDNQADVYSVLSFDERLDLAIEALYNRTNVKKTKRLLKSAKLRYPNADVSTLHYDGRQLDRNQILTLANCDYFSTCKNIIINGFTGSGKTHLACALGKEACRHLYRTRYIRLPDMLEMFNLAEQTGNGISRLSTKMSNYCLLVIDEWLLEIPTEIECKYLLEILEKRHDKWPTIFCSQYEVSEWYPRLGSDVMAESIMDRIVHNSIIINTGNCNMREFLANQQS